MDMISYTYFTLYKTRDDADSSEKAKWRWLLLITETILRGRTGILSGGVFNLLVDALT